jgi:hypothetical protein
MGDTSHRRALMLDALQESNCRDIIQWRSGEAKFLQGRRVSRPDGFSVPILYLFGTTRQCHHVQKPPSQTTQNLVDSEREPSFNHLTEACKAYQVCPFSIMCKCSLERQGRHNCCSSVKPPIFMVLLPKALLLPILDTFAGKPPNHPSYK